LATLIGHTASITAIEPLSTGNLASSDYNGVLIFWNLATQTIMHEIPQPHSGYRILFLVMMSTGKLASADSDKCITAWDLTTFTNTTSNCNFWWLMSMTESGNVLFVADNSFKVFALNEAILQKIGYKPGWEYCMTGSADGAYVALCENNGAGNFFTFLSVATVNTVSYSSYSPATIMSIDRYQNFFFTVDNNTNAWVWKVVSNVVTGSSGSSLITGVSKWARSIACLNSTGKMDIYFI
jgi:WD40 repeat protein